MNNEDQFIGYLINIGVTTCRLFGVREDESLKELSVNSYGILPENEGYFEENGSGEYGGLLCYTVCQMTLLIEGSTES